MLLLLLRTIATLTILSRVAFSATLVVDNAGGPGLFTTIQAAIDAASAGDTVQVRKNSLSIGWQEAILVNKANLIITGVAPVTASKSYFMDGGKGSNNQCDIFCSVWRFSVGIFNFLTFGIFEGPKVTNAPTGAPTPDDGLDEVTCPDTILDGGTGFVDSQKIIMTVTASGVTIQQFSFRLGTVVFDVGSDNCTFRNNCIFPVSGPVVRTTNGARNNMVLDRNQFFNGLSRSIDLECNGCVLSENTIVPCDNGIVERGNDNTVRGNTLRGCNDESINLVGNNAIVSDNLLVGGDDGIDIVGNNPIVTGNIVTGFADDAIIIDCLAGCMGGRVANNYIEGSNDDAEGIVITRAVNFVIENNTILYATEVAMEYDGSNGIIRRNKIRFTGTESRIFESGIQVDGNDNLVEANILQFVYTGIRHRSGDRATYRTNVVDNASIAGIVVQDGTSIRVDNNTISNCQGDAISLTGGTGIIVVSNRLTDNRLDLCNEVGANADVTGQIVSTSSAVCNFF